MFRNLSITAIIPVFNREKQIANALTSVLSQTRRVHEIIVVDDGSMDRSVHVAETFSDRHGNMKIIRQRNAGPSSARNVGVQHATGEWIAFLDSDDQWLPNKIEACEKELGSRPEVDFLHSAVWIDNGSETKLVAHNRKALRESKQEMLATFGIKTSSVVVRKNLFVKVGGFRDELRMCEDFELFWRMIVMGRELGYLEDGLVKIGRSDNSLMSNMAPEARAVADIRAIRSARRWIIQNMPDKCYVAALSSLLEGVSLDLCRMFKKSGNYSNLMMQILSHGRCEGVASAFRIATIPVRRRIYRSRRSAKDNGDRSG